MNPTAEYLSALQRDRENLDRLIAFVFQFGGPPDTLISAYFSGNRDLATDEAVKQIEFVYGMVKAKSQEQQIFRGTGDTVRIRGIKLP